MFLDNAMERINRLILQGGRNGMTELQFYAAEIREWKNSLKRMDQIKGADYYEGRHDILNRKRTIIGADGKLQEVDNLPNNRLIDNQYALMVDQKTNYLVGKPFTVNCQNKAYGNQVDSLDALLKKVVGNGYTHTAFEVQKGVGLGWDITGLNQKKLETLLSKPWTTDGRTFRDRCWLNKNDLVGSVSKSLTQGLLRGDSPAKITTAIQKQFGVHRYKAGRLVNTETTYFNAVATKECYKDLDVEMVEIIETLDSHTCSICGGLDGTVIPISQYEPGVTVPPFHPNCRGTTAPAIDPKYAGERAARNADGDVYYVPANMKYADWVQTFVNNGSKAGLTVATGAAIIKAKRALETLKPEMFPEYLTDKKELKNTKTLMEYVNGCENADPDVVALYAKMGDMENIRANGIPMKVSHGKNHAVNYRYYTRNDQLAEAELIIPKLAGDDLTGQVVTTLHEEMHLMDMFNRADPAKYSGWFSSSNAKLSAFFQKTNTDIADDIDALFEAFDKECERIAAEINAELRTATSALNDQY